MDDLVLRFQKIGDVAVISYAPQATGTPLSPDGGLYALVDQHHFTKVVLNFDGIVYLMSSRLGQIITLKHKLNKVQGQLRLCSMEQSLRDVFEVTRLDTLIPVYEDLEGAIRSFQ